MKTVRKMLIFANQNLYIYQISNSKLQISHIYSLIFVAVFLVIYYNVLYLMVVLLCCNLTSESASMVMSEWSVNLTTLFLGRLRP